MTRITLFLTAFISILNLTAIPAADWPEFRGPTGQGLYAGRELPTRWDAKTNVTWRTAIPGLGWSSPAIVGEKIYLTTATPGTVSQGEQSLRAMCLDAKTGKILWDKEVFHQDGASAPRIQAKNSHASPSPIVSAGRVFVHFGHQGTACLDLSGKIIWQNRDLKYPPVHGNGGSPVLIDGLLIFSCDGGKAPFVVALDFASGTVKWKKDRSWDAGPKKFAFCTPLAIQVNGATQVVLPGAGGVAAYDPKSGDEIWHALYGSGYSVVPRPVFGHGMVFLSTGYDSPELLAIRVDGQGDVTDSHIAWRLKRGAPLNPSPLLVGDELYLVSDQGNATCLDAKTGKVHWQERLRGAYSASPFFAGDHVYLLNEQGLTTVVKAATTFREVSKNDLSARTLATPAAMDGAIFLRTDKHLYRIEKK